MRRFINLFETPEKLERSFRWTYLGDGCFRSTIGKTIADKIVDRAKIETDLQPDTEAVDEFARNVINPIRGYLYAVLSTARDRRHDMSDWFALAHLTLDQILHMAQRRRAELSTARDDQEDEDEFNDENLVGFAAYDPAMDHAHYIRFGKPSRSGKSVFGLAGPDTEDGPDEWRIESGNKTSEAGICVFQAIRSLDDPQGWVIEMPDFARARYHVSDAGAYLQGILPGKDMCRWQKDHRHPVVYRMEGSVVRSQGRGRVFAELGSDGEYLLDASKPMKVTPIPLENIYILNRGCG